jgi:hypothetical protein
MSSVTQEELKHPHNTNFILLVPNEDKGESDSTYPCRKWGVMETFMSDFIVVSIL